MIDLLAKDNEGRAIVRMEADINGKFPITILHTDPVLEDGMHHVCGRLRIVKGSRGAALNWGYQINSAVMVSAGPADQGEHVGQVGAITFGTQVTQADIGDRLQVVLSGNAAPGAVVEVMAWQCIDRIAEVAP